MTGVVSVRLSKTLIVPRFSATKIRPSGENWMTDGWTSPLRAAWSWKPVGRTAANAVVWPAWAWASLPSIGRPSGPWPTAGAMDVPTSSRAASNEPPTALTRRRNPGPPDSP